jgi:tRNA-specific 2-thiouridylase
VKALFPIGELQKSEVRSIATQLNLITADKKDSQGLCFIGKVSLPDFLMQQLAPKEGRVIEIDRTHPSVLDYETQISHVGNADSALMRLALKPEMGVDIGVHRGAHFYTRGQRRGLNIGGKILPLFVKAEKEYTTNIFNVFGETDVSIFRKKPTKSYRDSGMDMDF